MLTVYLSGWSFLAIFIVVSHTSDKKQLKQLSPDSKKQLFYQSWEHIYGGIYQSIDS